MHRIGLCLFLLMLCFGPQSEAEIVNCEVVLPIPEKAELETGATQKTLFVETLDGETLKFQSEYSRGGELLNVTISYPDVDSFMETKTDGKVKKIMKIQDLQGRVINMSFEWVKEGSEYELQNIKLYPEIEPEKGITKVVYEVNATNGETVKIKTEWTK